MTALIVGGFLDRHQSHGATHGKSPHAYFFDPSGFEKLNRREEIFDLLGSGRGIAALAFPEIAEIEQEEIKVLVQKCQRRQDISFIRRVAMEQDQRLLGLFARMGYTSREA